MSVWRTLVMLGVLGGVTFHAPEAQAQGFAGTCARVLWNFVGKPLTMGMAQKGGELIAEHFADRLKDSEPGQQVIITENDINQLKRAYEARGMTECDMRRQLEQMQAAAAYGSIDSEPVGYSAESYCPMTGVVGYAEGLPSPQQALAMAASDCINRGGIPACCMNGAHLTE
jgi:hypothetical protein